MKNHPHCFFIPVYLILLIAACSEPKPITQRNTKTAISEHDPYFISSVDTVSSYGPKCITRDLLQDKSGLFWFATWYGIISYDGKTFTNHTLKNNLAKFHLLDVFEDSKANLWFPMAGGGVYVYDGKSFTRFTTHDGLVSDYVVCIAEDRNGNIWIGTDRGVSRYDGKVFTSVKDMNGKYINAILEDQSGLIHFGSSKGLFSLDAERQTLQPFTGTDTATHVLALCQDRSGKLWIGKMNGLSIYDPQTDSFTEELSGYLTYYIIEDKSGNIWLSHSEPNTKGTAFVQQVLYRYDGNRFVSVIEKSGENDYQLFGKTEDNSGNIWFGTMNGPCKYDGKNVTHFYR